MGSEPPGHYPEEMVYVIPTALVERLEAARAEVAVAERAVREAMVLEPRSAWEARHGRAHGC